MLANYSIRAKITAVVAFLLIAMTGMGLLAVKNMRSLNASTVNIATNWLQSGHRRRRKVAAIGRVNS